MPTSHVNTKIAFDKKMHDWDGFGFNYVQLSQTFDYDKYPQEYGGFSIISEQKRAEILDLVFGPEGLKPGLMKIFFDPFHQREENLNKPGVGNLDQGNYDHEKTTQWVRYFAREGLRLSREQGRDMRMIACLYGMPGWMTLQKEVRGRDIDPQYKEELAKYMASYVKYLKEQDKLPVRYISVHNEGEDYTRWPEDGSALDTGLGCDYNAYWTPGFVCEFVDLLNQVLLANGLEDVKPTPGETSNWTRFYNFGYAHAIADDEKALAAIGLITSHGFSGGASGETWQGDHRSAGVDVIREKRPALHSWVTSTSWSKMDAKFVAEIHGNIYSAKNNGIIPWAGVQRPAHWKGGDPNPGNAIQIDENGNYEVRNGYYYYKQVCPVGQPGMYVARTSSTDNQTCAIAFAANGTANPNAFVLVNSGHGVRRFDLTVSGTASGHFSAYRTSGIEKCEPIADIVIEDTHAVYYAPPNSVTTFVEK